MPHRRRIQRPKSRIRKSPPKRAKGRKPFTKKIKSKKARKNVQPKKAPSRRNKKSKAVRKSPKKIQPKKYQSISKSFKKNKRSHRRSKTVSKKSGVKNRQRKLKTLPTKFNRTSRNKSTNSKPKKIRLQFLEDNFVPRKSYDAYELTWTFHRVQGEPVAGINAGELQKLCNRFLAKHPTGLRKGRLIVNYKYRSGGSVKKRAVGTERVFLYDKDSWQDLLSAYNSVVLTLYDYDAEKFDEEKTPQIYIDSVVLELLHVENRDDSFDLS